jgi:hypothetical protein
MSAKQSTHWFWSDWAGDQAVRRLTPAERGLWIDLLCLAATAQPTGYVVDERGNALPLEEIARFANCSSTAECASLIDGILAKGAASRGRDGRLFNRRIVRDTELSVKRRRAGQAGAAATALTWQALNSLPRGLPEQVPRDLPQQTGTRAFPEQITKNLSGTARAREGSAMEPAAKPPPELPAPTTLAEVNRRLGYRS